MQVQKPIVVFAGKICDRRPVSATTTRPGTLESGVLSGGESARAGAGGSESWRIRARAVALEGRAVLALAG